MPDNTKKDALCNLLANVIQTLVHFQKRSLVTMSEDLIQFRNRLEMKQSGSRSNVGSKYPLFYSVSCILYQKDSLTMGELGKAIAVPLSTATGMIDWMVDNGYTQRLTDPEDRRIVRVALTHSGRSLYESLQDHMIQHMQQLLSCLTDEEQSSMSFILRKIAAAVREVEE